MNRARALAAGGHALPLMLAAVTALALVGVGVIGGSFRSPPAAPVGGEFRARIRAGDGLTLAIEELWTAFDREVGARNSGLSDLRAWLDGRGVRESAPGVSSELEILREDVAGATLLHCSKILTNGTRTEGEPSSSISRTWIAEVPRWRGTDHALLASDLSCVACHLVVDVVEGAPAARVAAAWPLVLREDTRVDLHGTLHLIRGAHDAEGREWTDWERAPLRFAPFDESQRLLTGEAAKLAPIGPMDTMRVSAQDGVLLGRCDAVLLPNARSVVETYPSATHRLEARGNVTGGMRHVVGLDGTPSSGAPGETAVRERIDGHLVLLGEAGAPFRIEGDVIIEGDLIVAGTFTGRGTLRAKGNVLVAGDLLRADPEARLAITADECLVVGDPFHPRWGETLALTGDERGSFGFAVDAIAQINGRLPEEEPGFRLLAGSPVPVTAPGSSPEGWGDAGLTLRPRGSPGRTVLPGARWLPDRTLRGLLERREALRSPEPSPVVVEAFLYARRLILGFAPSERWTPGGSDGRMRIVGGLVAEHMAIHAPTELRIEDDPDTRALLDLRAARGLVLRSVQPAER